MKIDKYTGLPKLREGLSWRVGKVTQGNYIGTPPPDKHGNPAVLYICVEAEVEDKHPVPRTAWERFWMSPVHYKTETTKWHVSGSTAYIYGTDEESILKAAKRAYRKVKEQDKINKLVGSYPPKRL